VKSTLAISAVAHVILLGAVIAPAYHGRGGGTIDVINVSLIAGGGGGQAPAVEAKVEPAKEPEVKETPSKMAYKPAAKPAKSTSKSAKTEKAKAGSSDKGKGTGTGSGTGSGPGKGSGSGIKVDDETFRFAYYLEVIRERIGYNWSPPALFGQKSEVVATVYFKIARDGSISDEKVENTSSHEIFDRAAIRAVKLTSPLPPLPAGFKGKYLGVHFEFQHTPG
jgi:TonB family protein